MTFLGDDLLVLFTDPFTGQSDIAVFDPLTLQDQGPLLEQPVGTATCWLELDPTGTRLYASSPDGTLFRFDTSGELLDSVSMPDLEWAGLAFMEDRLLAAYTDRSGRSGGIRMFDPETFDDLGNFLTFPPGHASGPFELLAANDSLYAAFLDGSIDRYGLRGNLLASIERPGVEWRDLAIAQAAAVPEPSSLVLLGSAAVILCCSARARSAAGRRRNGPKSP
jgi:hypothetical protein